MEAKAARIALSQNQPPEEEASSTSKRCKLWANLSDTDDSDHEPEQAAPVSDARVKEAFSYYWDSPRSLQSSDPLAFWHQNAHEYPEVYVVAKDTFTCPSGSVDSERLFSISGDILNARRTRLLPMNAEAQIFLAKNLPYFDYDY